MSSKLGTLTLDLIARIGQFTEPLDRAEKKVKSSASKIGQGFSDLGNLAQKAVPMVAGLAGTIAGVAASYITLDKVMGAQRAYDVQIAGLETATKSAENARTAYAALSQFAKETPYSMDQAVEGFTKLVNLGLTPSERALRSYGNTAAAMGKDLMQFIEAVADASTGEFERLKEFGVKASKQSEDVAFTFQGTTTTVKNSADSIEEYLMKIGENEFAGSMAKRMDSLDGSIANMEDSWKDLYLAISSAGVGELMRDGVDLASDGIQGLTALISSGAIEAGLAGFGVAFSIFGGDARSEMKSIADSFGLTSDFLVEKWRATIAELNALGNTWTTLRSWVQKASVSVAAGVDMISDPFNKRSSNASKQMAWEDSMRAIDAETIARTDAITKGFGAAEKKYNEFIATQKKGNTSAEDALARYKIQAKSGAAVATAGVAKTNRELEKQKKLLDGLGNGLVSNSHLRGLNIKSSESVGGGQIRGYTAEFAQLANSALGNSLNRFTAFNDRYHKGTNSRHATGNAFDFTLKNAKEAESAVKVLEDVARRYGYSVKILNEYKDPSKRATGGHLHVSVLGKSTKLAWKDVQGEVELIGKGNDEMLRLAEDLNKRRNSIYRMYATDLQKIELDNSEAIREIEEAYSVDDTSRQKYLELQKAVYQQDLEEFRKVQLQKQFEQLNAVQSMNAQIQGLSGNSEDIMAKASMSPQDFAEWSLARDRSKAQLDLQNSRTSVEQNIMTNDVYTSDDERYAALLQAHEEYLTQKNALDVQYEQNLQDVRDQSQAATLAGYGAMFGMMGSLLESYGEKSSASYRLAFALQKGFVFSSALLNAKGAVLAAWNDPSNVTLLQKIGAAAATVIQTNDLMSAIQGVALTGMAHDGIANVPKEGTWLLDGGERVLNPQQNKDLTSYLANKRPDGVNININVPQGYTAEQSHGSDGSVTIDIVQKVAQQEAKQSWIQLSNPNSFESKQLRANTTAGVRR
ncbi:tape measure protein [Acinetobacter sp. WCHAc010052]|uniref:tape measure protein n=1 Tax=Acinetobacter sp. WCHAc010052 TaxID=2004647 RepID=UPI000B3C56DB|nr:tape measure protein [Acinetobacter sp. WCHAc010052]AXY60029.1 hypothetical protein CDG61_08315 [Acinetobacter sp. WCHAc010052]